MAREADKFGKLFWTGLRQMQALRDALAWSLGGEAVGEATVNDWLRDQGFDKVSAGSGLSLVGVIGGAIDHHRNSLLGDEAYEAIQRGRRATHQADDDVGTERSGAGWANAANFCISSAFLRLLGAWEQYELDVLKSLVHYRPKREVLGPSAEQLLLEPDLAVVYEEPVQDPKYPNQPDKLIYALTPAWMDFRKQAENNIERRTLFSRTYDIETIPSTGKEERTLNNKRRDRWYVQRNAIAHGRANVTMPLAEYVEADVFVYRSVRFLAEQCREKHGLLV